MATEKRLISLDEALDATHREVFWTESEAAAVRSFLVKQPKVDAEEVVHGQWIEKPYLLGTTRYCSICGQNYGMPHGVFNYCPNCGAKMDVGNEDG